MEEESAFSSVVLGGMSTLQEFEVYLKKKRGYRIGGSNIALDLRRSAVIMIKISCMK